MKSVFKTAALACTEGRSVDSPFRKYYDYLVREKRYADYNARHAVARRIAALTLGVMKSGKKFDAGRLEQDH